MAKKVRKPVPKKAAVNPEAERRRLELRYLKRAYREQREIQSLAKRLRRATIVTQNDLVNLAGWLVGHNFKIVPTSSPAAQVEQQQELAEA